MHSLQLKPSKHQFQPTLTSKNTLLEMNKQEIRLAVSEVLLNVIWKLVSEAESLLLQNVFNTYSTIKDILKTQEGGKLLWHVINKTQLEMAEILVRAGANLEVRDPMHPERNWSLLHELTTKGHKDLALLMLQHKADVNAKDAEGKSLLYYAVQKESLVLVEELVNRKAKVFEMDEKHDPEKSALTLAAKRNSAELIELLVFSCKDEKVRNQRAAFVAEYLIDYGTEDARLLKMILDRGLPVDYTNSRGSTLLHYAITGGNVSLTKLLLDRGADANRSIADGRSPLYLASIRPTSDISILLIEKGADIHSVNRDGIRPIHVACHRQSDRIATLLLQLGADINVKDKEGRTPISLMTYKKPSKDVIKHFALLMALQKPVNESDMALIHSNADAKDILLDCLEELQNAKNEIVLNNLSYFNILSKNPSQLTSLVKNKKIIAFFRNNAVKFYEKFPIYCNDMIIPLEIAVMKRKILNSNEMILTEIFEGILPDLVVEKIAYYWCLDDLKNTEKNMLLRWHKLVNRRMYMLEMNCLVNSFREV